VTGHEMLHDAAGWAAARGDREEHRALRRRSRSMAGLSASENQDPTLPIAFAAVSVMTLGAGAAVAITSFLGGESGRPEYRQSRSAADDRWLRLSAIAGDNIRPAAARFVSAKYGRMSMARLAARTATLPGLRRHAEHHARRAQKTVFAFRRGPRSRASASTCGASAPSERSMVRGSLEASLEP